MIALLLALQFISFPAAGDQASIDARLVRFIKKGMKDPSSVIIKRNGTVHAGVYITGGGLLTGRRVEHPVMFQCYKVNGKNSYGGYAGVKDYAFRLESGVVTDLSTSPYYNIYAHRDIVDSSVESACPTETLVDLSGPPPTGQAASEAEELERFANLRDRGVITNDEFEAKKRAILGVTGAPKP